MKKTLLTALLGMGLVFGMNNKLKAQDDGKRIMYMLSIDTI